MVELKDSPGCWPRLTPTWTFPVLLRVMLKLFADNDFLPGPDQISLPSTKIWTGEALLRLCCPWGQVWGGKAFKFSIRTTDTYNHRYSSQSTGFRHWELWLSDPQACYLDTQSWHEGWGDSLQARDWEIPDRDIPSRSCSLLGLQSRYFHLHSLSKTSWTEIWDTGILVISTLHT